jgi:hypothetical protein
MKASIKLAVVSALALMGGVANAANLNTSTATATGSNLLLLLKNATDNAYLAFELAPTVSDVKSQVSLLADADSIYSNDCPSGVCSAGSLTVPAALNGYSNSNLSSYLTAATNIGDNITWTIMGGKTSGAVTQASNVFVYGATVADQLQSNWVGDDVVTSAGGVKDLIAEINSAPFANGVSSGLFAGGYGSSQPVGSQAPGSFFSSFSAANGSTLGTAQSLFLVSQTAGAPNAANVYKSDYTLTLNAAGVLSYNAPTSAVPVPAAIWLLGSGLMGLVGIGRRRNVAVAA